MSEDSRGQVWTHAGNIGAGITAAEFAALLEQTPRGRALARLREITRGIDADQNDDGWWETSTGAAFGTDVLRQLEALISDLT